MLKPTALRAGAPLLLSATRAVGQVLPVAHRPLSRNGPVLLVALGFGGCSPGITSGSCLSRGPRSRIPDLILQLLHLLRELDVLTLVVTDHHCEVIFPGSSRHRTHRCLLVRLEERGL